MKKFKILVISVLFSASIGLVGCNYVYDVAPTKVDAETGEVAEVDVTVKPAITSSIEAAKVVAAATGFAPAVAGLEMITGALAIFGIGWGSWQTYKASKAGSTLKKVIESVEVAKDAIPIAQDVYSAYKDFMKSLSATQAANGSRVEVDKIIHS